VTFTVSAPRGLRRLLSHFRRPRPRPLASGQATAEYALVLLGAAAVAVLFITWVTAGGGAGKIGQLLDKVFDSLISRAQ